MFNKILVPIDGSATSLHVLKEAQAMAEIHGSTIYVLTVIPRPLLIEHAPSDFASQEIKKASLERGEFIIDQAKKGFTFNGPHFFERREGSPATEIINYADEMDADLIVMGNKGLGAFSRTFLGSVSNRVINSTKRPVLVIKDPHSQKD